MYFYNKITGIEECDRCERRYYKNSEGKCEFCYYSYIYGGYCKVCSDNETEYDTCFCDEENGYTKNGNTSCIECPYGCSTCKYKNNITQCTNCYPNFALDSDKNCTECCEGCNECVLDNENNTICRSCDSGILLENNTCLIYALLIALSVY